MELNDSPADIVRYLAIGLGLGTLPTALQPWPIFASAEPSTPDNCITMYDTSWRRDGRAMVNGYVFRHYGVQVRVRAVDHTTGFRRMQSIRLAFDEQVYQNQLTVNGTSYIVYSLHNTEVLMAGQDAPRTKRQILTMNPYVVVRVAGE